MLIDDDTTRRQWLNPGTQNNRDRLTPRLMKKPDRTIDKALTVKNNTCFRLAKTTTSTSRQDEAQILKRHQVTSQ
tara:strand:+ start:270 stop:494 length:225 start_codon:yes stop_codon:yes gene_type:complete